MTTTASPAGADNRAARDAILKRVGAALGRSPDAAARARAEAAIAAPVSGPRPAMPVDLVERFVRRSMMLALPAGGEE